MSSTNRGAKRSPADFYSTPPWVTHRLLDEGVLGPGLVLPGGRWLEPCAGDGELIRAVNEKREGLIWSANELREETLSVLKPLAPERWRIGDFLTWEPQRPELFEKFDVSITNPPFSIAMSIIQKSITISKLTVMLLRLNFWGSGDRQSFLAENPPDTFVLPNRPVFALNQYGKPGTDSPEYAWFLWGEYADGTKTNGRIRVLNQTPKEERKKWTEHVKKVSALSECISPELGEQSDSEFLRVALP